MNYVITIPNNVIVKAEKNISPSLFEEKRPIHEIETFYQTKKLQDVNLSKKIPINLVKKSYRELKEYLPENTTPRVSLSGRLRYETPWELFGISKDDPTWGELFDEIEHNRDMTVEPSFSS
ncbi:MAG: hypothetical protein GY795_36200 [Desulfobacterales bacterium]|nr:hypothetical protein [Desulfobacterales bacterium]